MTTKAETKNGRIYGRFSSKPQERGDSKRRQVEGAREYASRNNITIVGEPYFDEGVSGKDGANLLKEFGQIIADTKQGEIILCEESSRLGRQNPFRLCKLIFDIVSTGSIIILWGEGKTITKENINEMGTIFSVFAGAAVGHEENYRKINKLRETTKESYTKAKNGIQTGTLVKFLPQAFIWNTKTETIEIDEVKASVIRRIFNMFADGMGRTSIAQTLNKEKVPTLYTTPSRQQIGIKRTWLETSIKKVLKNESYAGVLNVKGHRLTCIPPIVERELFDNVQLLLKRNSNRHGNLSGRINNLFAGLAICKHCGGTINVNFTRQQTKKGVHTYYGYRCKNARLKNCSEPHRLLNSNVVELLFFTKHFGGSPENIIGTKNKENKSKIEAIENRIVELNTAIDNLYDMVEIGDKMAIDRIKTRKHEKAQLEAELTQLKGTVAEENNMPTLMDEIEEIMDYGNDNNKTMEALKAYYPKLQTKLADYDTRRKLVNALPVLFSKVVFDTTNKTIETFNKAGESLGEIDLVVNNPFTLFDE